MPNKVKVYTFTDEGEALWSQIAGWSGHDRIRDHEFRVLDHLLQNGVATSLTLQKEDSLLSKSQMSRLLQSMQKRGLIKSTNASFRMG